MCIYYLICCVYLVSEFIVSSTPKLFRTLIEKYNTLQDIIADIQNMLTPDYNSLRFERVSFYYIYLSMVLFSNSDLCRRVKSGLRRENVEEYG